MRYLNTNSSARLNTAAHTTAGRGERPLARRRPTQSPNSQLTRMEAAMMVTNRGSPKA